MSTIRHEMNLQDPIGKTVGRRLIQDPFAYGMQLQRSGAELQRTFRVPAVPRGVYRFRTFEEADQWMNDLLASRVS